MNKFEKELDNRIDIVKVKLEELQRRYNELVYLKMLYDETKSKKEK